jgi:hypothetical protein
MLDNHDTHVHTISKHASSWIAVFDVHAVLFFPSILLLTTGLNLVIIKYFSISGAKRYLQRNRDCYNAQSIFRPFQNQ